MYSSPLTTFKKLNVQLESVAYLQQSTAYLLQAGVQKQSLRAEFHLLYNTITSYKVALYSSTNPTLLVLLVLSGTDLICL